MSLVKCLKEINELNDMLFKNQPLFIFFIDFIQKYIYFFYLIFTTKYATH